MPISPAYPIDDDAYASTLSTSRLGLPPSVIGVTMALSVFGLATANPLMTVAAIAILPLLIALPWRPGEPPILPFILAFQWLQASIRVFHANVLGVDVSELIIYEQLASYADVHTAIWLTFFGLLVLAVGMRLALRGLAPADGDALLIEAETFSIPRAFWLFLATSVGVTALGETIGYFSGFRQMVDALSYLKWATYFFMAVLVLSRNEGYKYLAVGFGYEFITGIGFFSTFKEVIIVTALAYFTVRSKVTLATAAKGVVLVFFVTLIGSAWTVVKPDFREAVGEENAQGAVVGQDEQVATLVRLVGELDAAALGEGLEPLAQRLAYVDMFGYAIEHVPSVVPHEDGLLWWTAVKHILTPRILFPSKPEIAHDSEITNRYTGLLVAGVNQGTSISIGYMGESYIDFGPFWMFAPIFLVGLWRGLMYRYFMTRRTSQLFSFAFVVSLFTTLYELEKATGKMFGGLMMRFIVLALIFRFVAPYALEWLRRTGSADPELDEWTTEEPALIGSQPTWS